MADNAGDLPFIAFREQVFDDFALQAWLHGSIERDAFIARVVEAGREHGFGFEADDVRAVMREGELTWLTQGSDIA